MGTAFAAEMRAGGLRRARAAACRRGTAGDGLGGVVQAARASAEAAQEQVEEDAVASSAAKAGKHGGKDVARQIHNSCHRRLTVARELMAAGVDFFRCGEPVLFHEKTGLGKLQRRLADWPSEKAWGELKRQLRGEVARAGAAVVRSMGGGLGRLVRTARRLVASEEAPTVKYVAAWRSIAKPRVSLELDTLHVGDVADGEEVSAFSAAERFAAIGGDSGRLFMESMDGGASVRAFAAWCDVFLQRWDRLRARDGGWWSFD